MNKLMKGEDLFHNAVQGKGVANRDQLMVDSIIDKEKAQIEAFGDSLGEKRRAEMDYESYQNAMQLVRKNGSESEAKSNFSEELKERLSKLLKIDKNLIKIFNSVGTPLDKYHKISAWVEINEASAPQGKILITLDIFTDEKNKRNKAEVVFQKPAPGFDSANTGNEEYESLLQDVSEKISDKFEKKAEKNRGDRIKSKGLMPKKKKVTFGKRGTGKQAFVQ